MWWLTRFKWYRKWRGGKWGQVTGWWWGRKWIKLPEESLGWDEFYQRLIYLDEMNWDGVRLTMAWLALVTLLLGAGIGIGWMIWG
jgi:hypothetical protein